MSIIFGDYTLEEFDDEISVFSKNKEETFFYFLNNCEDVETVDLNEYEITTSDGKKIIFNKYLGFEFN